MAEPTYKQFKILKELSEHGRQCFNDADLTDDHWELVRSGYVKNFVSLGVYSWKFEITQKGVDYITLQD